MGGRGWGPFCLETDKIIIRVHRFAIAARVAELQCAAWTNGKGQKQTCHNLFSRCHGHEALTSVAPAELQAQNCTSHMSVCSDLRRRSTGSQHWPATRDANVDTSYTQWLALSSETPTVAQPSSALWLRNVGSGHVCGRSIKHTCKHNECGSL